jgi:glycosyltransferase involved in cell wall biosynthesis
VNFIRVGMVSIYPPQRSKHAQQGGVASYSKNLVYSLLKYCSVIIFADKLSSSGSEYSEGAVVHRCWSKNVKYPFQIFKKLLETGVDIVHVQYETYLYGGLISALVFPFFLALVRLLRKPVIVTMHGVVPLSRVNRCFLEENRIAGNPLIMHLGLALLVKISVSLSTAVIVHEKELKVTLTKEYRCDGTKIHVIHHGIEDLKISVTSAEAKNKLGVKSKRVILFFGYITGYKNVGLLIDSAKFLKVNDWVMLIAGGVHPRLASDGGYLKYLSDLRKQAAAISEKQILFRGFVPEQEIAVYFSASDLVVFPHNICISSSGPLSLAASYCKPFLVSKSFRDVVEFDDIVFENESKELASKIDFFFSDETFSLNASEYSKNFRASRFWSRIAMQTYKLYGKVVLTN